MVQSTIVRLRGHTSKGDGPAPSSSTTITARGGSDKVGDAPHAIDCYLSLLAQLLEEAAAGVARQPKAATRAVPTPFPAYQELWRQGVRDLQCRAVGRLGVLAGVLYPSGDRIRGASEKMSTSAHDRSPGRPAPWPLTDCLESDLLRLRASQAARGPHEPKIWTILTGPHLIIVVASAWVDRIRASISTTQTARPAPPSRAKDDSWQKLCTNRRRTGATPCR
ncbi:hypothetical protein B0T11DRAFT_294821 [Plectosphaerella cucumerina]|uniref:Uncharacterized protein n=1 Tax=Plectosphaerella cucumerina TaxID=40658 RepID=A0A8K0TP42_9PEZI|nr:hypothetical protein B0T11DRAFT_294821 [Plectosphaerella cucumerina]